MRQGCAGTKDVSQKHHRNGDRTPWRVDDKIEANKQADYQQKNGKGREDPQDASKVKVLERDCMKSSLLGTKKASD